MLRLEIASERTIRDRVRFYGSQLLYSRLAPPRRQVRQVRQVRCGRLDVARLLRVLALGAQVGLPAGAALGEDAREQGGGRLEIGMLRAPCFGELALDGGLEDGGAVALERGLGATQSGDTGVQAGELLLDGGDDAVSSARGATRNGKAFMTVWLILRCAAPLPMPTSSSRWESK
jgi:hypothetical protein